MCLCVKSTLKLDLTEELCFKSTSVCSKAQKIEVFDSQLVDLTFFKIVLFPFLLLFSVINCSMNVVLNEDLY